MAKVVYNECFGGFGLSDEAVRMYAAAKGLTLYPEVDAFGFTTYWLVPISERTGIVSDDNWWKVDKSARIVSNKRYGELVLSPGEIERTDQDLVKIVETLEDRASGPHADLKIRTIPAGAKYKIDEYDGFESVMMIDEYIWQVAD